MRKVSDVIEQCLDEVSDVFWTKLFYFSDVFGVECVISCNIRLL